MSRGEYLSTCRKCGKQFIEGDCRTGICKECKDKPEEQHLDFMSEIIEIVEGGLEYDAKKVRAYAELLLKKMQKQNYAEYQTTMLQNRLNGKYKSFPALKTINWNRMYPLEDERYQEDYLDKQIVKNAIDKILNYPIHHFLKESLLKELGLDKCV